MSLPWIWGSVTFTLPRTKSLITVQMIDQLRHQSELVTMTPEVRAYLQNIVVFLRLERGVIGGISPYATTLFEALTKSVLSCFLSPHGD